MRLAIVILILIALGLPSDVMAQESQQTPKTKVEAFTGVIGAVLIKDIPKSGL
jgi:cytochrome c biogenesis protein ResB